MTSVRPYIAEALSSHSERVLKLSQIPANLDDRIKEVRLAVDANIPGAVQIAKVMPMLEKTQGGYVPHAHEMRSLMSDGSIDAEGYLSALSAWMQTLREVDKEVREDFLYGGTSFGTTSVELIVEVPRVLHPKLTALFGPAFYTSLDSIRKGKPSMKHDVRSELIKGYQNTSLMGSQRQIPDASRDLYSDELTSDNVLSTAKEKGNVYAGVLENGLQHSAKFIRDIDEMVLQAAGNLRSGEPADVAQWIRDAVLEYQASRRKVPNAKTGKYIGRGGRRRAGRSGRTSED